MLHRLGSVLMVTGAVVAALAFIGVEVNGFRVILGDWRLAVGSSKPALYAALTAMVVGTACVRVATRRERAVATR